MEDKEMKRFSFTAFFLVTGLSFFLFSKLLLFLDGTKLPVFTWIGILSIVIGLFKAYQAFKAKPEKNSP